MWWMGMGRFVKKERGREGRGGSRCSIGVKFGW